MFVLYVGAHRVYSHATVLQDCVAREGVTVYTLPNGSMSELAVEVRAVLVLKFAGSRYGI